MARKYDEAHKRATIKYQKENLQCISLRYQMSLGFRDQLQEHAALTGESMSAFIFRACQETMARDKANIAQMLKEKRRTE